MMRLMIKPRIQKDKWSLYWKTSMCTKTELLDPLELEVEPTITAKALKARVASMLQWEPVDELLRLEGFGMCGASAAPEAASTFPCVSSRNAVLTLRVTLCLS